MNEKIRAQKTKHKITGKPAVPEIERTGCLRAAHAPADSVSFFQKTLGNQAVGRFMRRMRGGSREGGVTRAESGGRLQDLQGGETLLASTRAFFEPRFGVDFSRVRVHTDSLAAETAQQINAQAFTCGHDILFGPGQYQPRTVEGQRLLAHELTHVLQQETHSPSGSATIQRRVYEGHDHGGRYELDDNRCSLVYHQNWFFTFQTDQTGEEREAYMEAARLQIEDVWSHKYPLVPDGESCPCRQQGIDVNVVMHPYERNRQGRGFSIIVTPNEDRGLTNPPAREIDLGPSHETPVSTGQPGGQRRIAHEFAHTINLPDEYTSWARFFRMEGSRDRPSIMYAGDEVRPRHYQPFADLVNFEIASGCTYAPGGERFRELENPVNPLSGVAFPFSPERADFLIGLNYDRRVSNEAVLGLAYPTLGLLSLWDPRDRSVRMAATAGLRLNRLAHPLYFNVRTGLAFDPVNPRSVFDLSIPISSDLGIQGHGFQVGMNYTGIVDILSGGNWTHIVGIGLQVDLP